MRGKRGAHQGTMGDGNPMEKAEEQLRAVFEAAQDAIFTKDREGRYTQVNPACASLFGLTVKER